MIVVTIFLFIIFQTFCNVDSFLILKLKSHDWLILLCIGLTGIAGSILGTGREHHWRQVTLRNLAGAPVTGCVNLGQSLNVSGESVDPQSERCYLGNTSGILESGDFAASLWLFSDKPLNCVKLNFLIHKNGSSESKVWHSVSRCYENLPFSYGPYKLLLTFLYPCVTGANVVFQLNSLASNLLSSSFFTH